MQLLTVTPGSGKLGGAVSTQTRTGSRLHARSARIQPRTTRQVAARALTGSLASAWRALSPLHRKAWNALASGSLSGVNLFTSCNRNLLTLGAPGILAAPNPRPTFPAIHAFTVTPIYTGASQPRALYAWQLDTTPELDGTFAVVVRATQCLSAAKGNIRASDLRIVAAAPGVPTPAFIPSASWFAVWGSGPTEGTVTFELNLVDSNSGFAAPRVRASSPYDATGTPLPIGWTTTIEQEGLVIALVPSQIFQQDGEPIAGP